MTWITCTAIFLLFSVGPIFGDQNDDYSSGVAPPRLSKWPDSLKDYQELPMSRSPNGRYAFIYPRRNVVEEMDNPRLYMSGLKPFRIIEELPIKYGNLCENTGSSYSVTWARDSSAAIFYVGGKKGPFSIFVASGGDNRLPSAVDLEEPIRKIVQTDYDSSHAPRFNDYFDFIFTDGDDVGGLNGKDKEIESSWSWNGNHEVLVKCICTNDPKRLSNILWEVVFSGTWDVAKQTFIKHHLERITQDRLPPLI